MLTAGCSDQAPLISPAASGSGPSFTTSAQTTEVLQVRDETALAVYLVETGCVETHVVIIGSEEAKSSASRVEQEI